MNFVSNCRWTLLLCAISSSIATAGAAADPAERPADAPIATIDGKVVSYADLRPVVQEKLDLLQKQYEDQLTELTLGNQRNRAEFISSQASNLVDNRILSMEAKARKTTPAALIGALQVPDTTDAEIRAFYASQRAQIGQSYDSVAPQIKQYLHRQAAEQVTRRYFETLRTRYEAVITLEPMREQVEALGPQRGSDAARVTIVEFSDFQCPYCGKLEPVLAQILKTYPAQVRLIYRNMPLTALHPDAHNAAEAAVCAGHQGKFWEMHDTLFSEQNALSLEALKEKAKRLGLDSEPFDTCLDSGQARASIKVDEEASRRLGLLSTPASFVNGRFVNGAVSFDELSSIIQDELRRAALTARR